MDARRLAEHGAALLGGQLRNVQPLSGGDLSIVARIELADGRVAAVKNGPAPPVEAAMLRAIAASGAPVPEVLAVDADVLLLSWVEGADSLSSAWGDLGTVVSQLHSITGPHYGWQDDYAFGALQIRNGWCDNWPQFWSERRLLPQVPFVPAELGRRIEKLAADLPNRLPARPPAALLHGDLWGGNVMVHGNRIAALIDPCCYHGHAEVDLAMLQLFGAPSAEFFESYGPLQPDSRERLAIYRLWPALVHLRLFGEGYRGLAEAQLKGVC